MSFSKIIYPPKGFDYGDVVEWTGDDGETHQGSIYGFSINQEDLEHGEAIAAYIEIADGRSFEIKIGELKILE